MNKYTLSGATANEQEVCSLLNKFDRSSFELSGKRRSVFDIKGFTENIPTLVEVKERSKWWNNLWIEESKLLSIFAKAKKYKGGKVNCWLVVSVKGEHLLYDAKDIWKYGTRQKHQMNHETAEGTMYEGSKINKDVIVFKKESYAVNLVTQELGESYESAHI